MSRLTSLAIVLIAFSSVLSKAQAQTAYRCGNSYSQTPCPGGVPVDANDSRSKAQKAQSESVIKRDLRTANSIEKTRLQREEAQARAAQKSTEQPAARPAATEPPSGKPTHNARKKSKDPEYFTARTSGDKKKKKSEPTSPPASTAGNASAEK